MASLTVEERAELEQLNWMHTYYLDSWMATMKVLDSLRPGVLQLRDRTVELAALTRIGEISDAECGVMLLAAMREWKAEYDAVMQRMNSGREKLN